MKTATDSPRTALGLGTPLLAGAVGLWVAWLALVAPERTALVVTFASVVIVPLGLAEAAGRYTGPVTQLLDTLANYAPLLGLFTLASYTVEAGPLAALLALPWMAFTCVVGATGVARLLSRRTLRDPGVSVDCGLVFLVVGGAWLVLSRGGVAPMGFSPAIVELTAVHFHYAGFALPIVAGVVALRLEAAAYIPLAVVGGVPLTAVGITLGGVTEWIAATVMALAGLCAAALTLRLARRLTPAPGALLAVAAGALTVGMLLAIGWAWSLRFGWSYLDLDAMVSTHGFLNGFGFCLLGLIALRLSPRPAGDHGDVCLHAGRPASHRTPGRPPCQSRTVRHNQPDWAVGAIRTGWLAAPRRLPTQSVASQHWPRRLRSGSFRHSLVGRTRQSRRRFLSGTARYRSGGNGGVDDPPWSSHRECYSEDH